MVVLSRNIGTNPWHPFVLLIPMSITVARTVCLLSIEITYVNPISILEHHSKCVILQVLIHSAMDWNSNFSLKSSVVIAGKVEMTSSLGKISSFWPFSFIFGDILTDKATPLYKRRRANVYFYFIVNNPMIYGVYARLFCREKGRVLPCATRFFPNGANKDPIRAYKLSWQCTVVQMWVHNFST